MVIIDLCSSSAHHLDLLSRQVFLTSFKPAAQPAVPAR
jgi:hypothetical protein